MDPKDAAQLLGSGGPSMSPVLTNDPSALPAAPLTEKALQETDVNLKPTNLDTPDMASTKQALTKFRQNYREANQQGDVPLDIDTGLPGWTRMMMSFRREQSDKVAYLENQYGKGSVRLSHDGVPIVRVLSSETGKPKDIRATELGMSASDFFDLAGQMPEIAGSILATRAGGPAKPGVLNRFADLLKMAIGAEGAGAVKDVGARLVDKQPIQPGEIAKSRSEMALGDVAVGSVLGGGGKLATKAITPNFQADDEVTQQFREAAEYFKNKGFNLPMTPGESSGLPILQRSEAILHKLPGSSAPLKEVVDQQNAELARIQKAAMGLSPDASASDVAALPTQEQVGEKAVTAIGSKVNSMKQDVKTAGQELAETGQEQLGKTIESATPGGPVDVPKLGQSLRESAMTKRTQFLQKSAEDYAKVYEHPLAKEYNISGGDLSQKAQDALKQMPAPETITEKPTGITDKFGNEILRDETGRKIMRNFVPANVLTKLNDLAAVKDGKFRLGDLIKMRTDVANDIAQGEAIPGMDTHWLKSIRNMLTESIEGGLDKLDSPELKNLWKTANDNYANGVKPFQKSGIAEIFKEQGQGGYLGDTELVDRAMSGGARAQDTFAAYKEFYGAASPEFGQLKRAVMDKLVGSSQEIYSDTINAKQFMQNLGQLAKNSPSIAKEVLGSRAQPLMNIAKAMAYGDSGELIVGGLWKNKLEGNIDAAEFQKMLASGEPTAQKLAALVNKEKQLGDAYRTDLIRKIGTGNFEGEKIDPSKFVRYFSTQAPPQDIQKVVSLIHDNPQVLQDIKTKTVQDIFDRAYPSAKAVDNPALLSGEPRVLSQQGLQDALGDATQRERYKLILGNDTYRDLEELTKFLAPRQRGEQAFSAAGGLSAGMQIAGLLKSGDLKYLRTAVTNWVLAKAYTTPILRQWLGNQLVTPETSAKTLRYLIASAPMVEAAHKTFGAKGAEDVMAEINESINRNQQESGQGDTGSDGRTEQFKKMLDGQ